MPTIELLGSGWTHLQILATMIYPREGQQKPRAQWCASAMANSYVRMKEEGAPENILATYHRLIPDLWSLKQSPERVLRDGIGRGHRAALCGFTLNYLIALARCCPRHCKLERARAIITRFLAVKATSKPASESLLEKVWAEFKPVAHFWAAQQNLYETSGLGVLITANDAVWLEFLGFAEGYRRVAVSHGFLDPALTWRGPKNVKLQVMFPTVSIPNEVIEYLDAEFPE